MIKKQQTATTATFTGYEEYDEGFKEGKKEGWDYAVKQINNRFPSWLMVGVFVGFIIGFFLNQSIILLLSVLGIMWIGFKLKEVE